MPGIKTEGRKLPELRRLWEHGLSDHIIALAWSPDGKKLTAASVSGEIAIYSDDGAASLTLPGHDFGVTAIAWSADGKHFASAGQDGKIKLWDVAASLKRWERETIPAEQAATDWERLAAACQRAVK